MLPWEKYVHSADYNEATKEASGNIKQTGREAFSLAAQDGWVCSMAKLGTDEDEYIIREKGGPTITNGGIERAKELLVLEVVYQNWKLAYNAN